MKLLVVDHNAVLFADRGVYRRLARKKDIDLTLLVPRRWTEPFGTTSADHGEPMLRVIPVKGVFEGKSHRVFYPALGRYVKSIRPDIIYVNSEPEGFLASQGALLAKRHLPHAKLVIDSWRNVDYADSSFPYKLSKLHSIGERFALRHADHCVVHNKDAAEILSRNGFSRATIIPPPVDLEVFTDSGRTMSGESIPDSPVVGYAGRIIKEKGIDLLLHAVASLPFSVQLLIVGSGPHRAKVKRIAESLGISRRVVWANSPCRANMAPFFRSMNVLVLPSITTGSWKEQFGRVLIEAMACGTPVIGSTSGEIPTVIDGAGIVFKEGSVEALALALQRVLSSKDIAADLSRRGLERVRKYYSVDVVADKFHDLFLSLA